jgi:hypothetical protein|nr:MAG TPA: hypothetical protein [Caudoviricetes sp.]
MITYADASGPVTGEPGDPEHGACRVCMFHDAPTGALMYRVEKESSLPAEEAELIAIHVNAAYAKRLLSYIQSQEGGELGAKGCMLLVRGATLASDTASHTSSGEVRKGFPDPRRPTSHNPQGSPDWRAEHPDLHPEPQAGDAVIASEHLLPSVDPDASEPMISLSRTGVVGAITGGEEEEPELF